MDWIESILVEITHCKIGRGDERNKLHATDEEQYNLSRWQQIINDAFGECPDNRDCFAVN